MSNQQINKYHINNIKNNIIKSYKNNKAKYQKLVNIKKYKNVKYRKIIKRNKKNLHTYNNNSSAQLNNIICWNINGGLNKKSCNHELILNQLNQYNPYILLTQETMGVKGCGYIIRNKNELPMINNMKMVTMDHYGVTAIYISNNIKEYVVIDIPLDIYGNVEPKNTIHTTAIIIFIDKLIRNRDNIIYINMYRSPNKNAIKLKNIKKLFKYIHNFTNDDNPNIICGGDLNIWSNLIGNELTKKINNKHLYKKKYEDGDELFDIMTKLKMININGNQPTMWKYNIKKDKTMYYAVDTIWCNMNLLNHISITSYYNNEIQYSDHYPNEILIQSYKINSNNSNNQHKQYRYIWNINNVSSDKCDIYKTWVHEKTNDLQSIINETKKNVINTKAFIHSLTKTLCDILLKTAITIFGRKKKSYNQKQYINESILKIINNIHKLKKKIKPILNRVKKLKKLYIKNNNNKISDDILKKELGDKQFKYYKNFQLQEKNKKKLIKSSKKQWINQQLQKLITNNKNRSYYNTLKEIENIYHGNKDQIEHIIKPEISTTSPDNKQKYNLTYNDFTKTDKETADVINEYFNTIGNQNNPNHHKNIETNRNKARRFDKYYDFIPNKHPNYKKELYALTKSFEKKEIIYIVNNLENNKKTYDYDDINLHILFIKNTIKKIANILIIIFNFWKDTGIVTNNMNKRAVHPLKKENKSHIVVKGLRPLSIEKILWKIYQMLVDYRCKIYITNLKIINLQQFASKKGCNSEDCLINLTLNINKSIEDNQPVHIASIDSSEAYDSMDKILIYDKLKYNLGFNKKGIIMYRSILEGRTSITIINGIQSESIYTLSGPYQGAPPSSTLWCIYINPLMQHIEREMVLLNNKYNNNNHNIENNHQNMYNNDYSNNNHSNNNNNNDNNKTLGRINCNALMDDISIWTQIYKNAYILNDIPRSIQIKMSILFQRCINIIIYYLNINNITTNDKKTQIMTIHERNYKKIEYTKNQIEAAKIKYINMIKRMNENNSKIVNQNIDTYYDEEIDNRKIYKDKLYYYRNQSFYANNEMQKKKSTLKLLGIILDENWSFEPQINEVANKMKYIRIKLQKLIYSNKCNINMDTIKNLLISTSFQLINYTGNIYLNQSGSINPIKNEYYKSIQILHSRCWNTSLISRTHFNGFNTFESLILNLNSKSFSRLLRLNNNNLLYQYKNDLINKWIKWEEDITSQYMINGIDFDINDKLRLVPEKFKYDIT